MVYPPVLSKKITILMQCKASGRWQPPQPTYKASTHLTSRLRKFTALANTHGLISTHGAIAFLARRQNRTFMCSRTASRLRQSAQTTHKASTHLTSRLLKVTALHVWRIYTGSSRHIIFSHQTPERTFMCSGTASRLREPSQPTYTASTHLPSRLRKVTTTMAYTHGKLEIAGSFPAKNAPLNV